MLINFPFVPETQETLNQWRERAKEIGLSEEDFIKGRFDRADRYIPENLTSEESNLEDTSGLYAGSLAFHYQSVSLEEGFEIEGYPDFLPVSLKEKRIDDDADEDNVYTLQESLLYDSYGWVLSIDDFMTLIGKQLKDSKREFAVCFYASEYHDNLFYKSGRLYHPDHSAYELSEGQLVVSFHVFELLSKDSFVTNHDEKMSVMSAMFNSESYPEAKDIADNLREKEFVTNIYLEHKKIMDKSCL